MEKAINYIEKEVLPPHWDKDNLFIMGEESTTESSETESLLDDDDDEESPEEKDHLVAELYKHMEDRGQPINKTPSIGNKDVRKLLNKGECLWKTLRVPAPSPRGKG